MLGTPLLQWNAKNDGSLSFLFLPLTDQTRQKNSQNNAHRLWGGVLTEPQQQTKLYKKYMEFREAKLSEELRTRLGQAFS